MRFVKSVSLLGWSLCWHSFGSALEHFRAKDYLNRHQFLNEHHQERDDDYDDSDVQELYMTQKLDHFDPSNKRTYQQRYFYSDRYVSSDNTSCTSRSVTFLCVGGEGPGFDKSVLIDSVHCTGDMLELAARLFQHYNVNVHIYALEHRYYGNSYPTFGDDDSDDDDDDDDTSPVTTKHLKYLSSRQALEDLSHFVHSQQVEQMTAFRRSCGGNLGDHEDNHHHHHHHHHGDHSDHDFEDDPMPWVTFGGSYPGYMAGNARLKYPHLIAAAVSNSAPLDLSVDFPGYNERVGWDLQYEKIGGSQECHRLVKEGHNQAVALLETNPVQLARMFHVCDPIEALEIPENQNLLLGDGLIEIYVQGNDPSCSDGDDDDDDSNICNVARLCETMLDSLAERNGKTELEVLQEIAALQRGWNLTALKNGELQDGDYEGSNCQSINYEKLLRNLARPVVEPGGWRSWLWQTCTEVGFYQTCHENCPYASFYHTVEQDLAICEAAYNITTVYENVQSTKDYYGGLDISGGSRVLSVNGNVDPWSVLGLHESPKYSLPVAMVPGASHHFWTHRVKATDAPEIVQIREYIYSVVMDWLDIDQSSTSVSSSSSEASSSRTLENAKEAFGLRGVVSVE